MFAIPDLSAMSSASTLVETVSLDYDDFSDSFLTCGTCLCQYDAGTSAPKLLPCSHTVCRSCLERIVEASRDNTQVRCPICRENIPMPRGGVAAFPPSFIVNQLLDLMARQRRDVIPKCSSHSNQELLFCESCDAVFCHLCTGGAHNGGRGGAAHTVIPFSIAIKRMSEILLYKASLCLSHLGRALDVVAAEMDAVDVSSEKATEAINKVFNDVTNTVEQRRRDVLQSLRKLKDDKQRVLKEQLDIISAEKCKVESECHGLQQQVEVRNITKKISDLNDKLDVSSTLAEPRENSFMCFEYTHNNALHDLVTTLDNFGRIRISKTFPSLCTAEVEPSIVHLQSLVTVRTVDYHGNNRTSGADPVLVELLNEEGEEIETELRDHNDGTYTIHFTPDTPGKHSLSVTLFGRAIRDSPFTINVSQHNNPVQRLGSRGSSEVQFIQPCAVCIDTQGRLHVLDTGNSRIQVMDVDNGEFIEQSTGIGLEHRSCTGMSLVPGTDNIVVVNWRTKYICTFNPTGDVVQKFTCSEFLEPTSVAVSQHGETVVADNGHCQLLVFDSNGRFLRRIGGGKTSGKTVQAGSFHQITSVYCTPDTDDILVTDKSRLQVFSRCGQFLHEVTAPALGKVGQFGGVATDTHGNLLATRQEKGKCVILVFDREDYRLRFMIDSHNDTLSRPSGLTTTEDGHVIVADLGNNCIKKYRYM